MVASRMVVVAVAALALVGCGAWRPTAEVIGVEGIDDDGRALFVMYGGCEGDLPVNVVEHDDRVVVEVGPGQASCDAIQGTRVELSEPLGDRVVVDGRTGRTVPFGAG